MMTSIPPSLRSPRFLAPLPLFTGKLTTRRCLPLQRQADTGRRSLIEQRYSQPAA